MSYNSVGTILKRGAKVVVDVPPPFPTSQFHLGHCLQYGIIINKIDLLRALGNVVHYQIGFDVNGVPISIAAKKQLGAEKHNRQKVISKCEQITRDNIRGMLKSFHRLGYDTSSYYTTRDSDFRSLLSDYTRDLCERRPDVFRPGHRLSRYCVSCATFVSKSEVQKRDIRVKSYYIKFPVEGLPDVQIWTTRPELMGSAVAMAYNPSDVRFKKYKNQSVFSKFTGTNIPFVESSSVNPEAGTGIQFVASFGSESDQRIVHECRLSYANHINEAGILTSGVFKDMRVEAATQLVEEYLVKFRMEYRTKMILTAKEVHSERSSCCRPVQYMMSDQVVLELSPEDKAGLIREITELPIRGENTASSNPDNFRQYSRLCTWISKYDNWCISRQYVFGNTLHTDFGDHTCDGWLDSSLTSIYLANKFSCEDIMRVQGADILTTWFFCSLVTQNYYNTLNNTRVGFTDVCFTPLVVGDDNLKMSKSKHNYRPQDLTRLTEGSADLLRLWCISYNSEKPFLKVDNNGISLLHKFLSKVENILRVNGVVVGDSPTVNTEFGTSLIHLCRMLVLDAAMAVVQSRSNPLIKIINFVNRVLSNSILRSEDKTNISSVGVCMGMIISLLSSITPDLVTRLVAQHNLEVPDLQSVVFSDRSLLDYTREELLAEIKKTMCVFASDRS